MAKTAMEARPRARRWAMVRGYITATIATWMVFAWLPHSPRRWGHRSGTAVGIAHAKPLGCAEVPRACRATVSCVLWAEVAKHFAGRGGGLEHGPPSFDAARLLERQWKKACAWELVDALEAAVTAGGCAAERFDPKPRCRLCGQASSANLCYYECPGLTSLTDLGGWLQVSEWIIPMAVGVWQEWPCLVHRALLRFHGWRWVDWRPSLRAGFLVGDCKAASASFSYCISRANV